MNTEAQKKLEWIQNAMGLTNLKASPLAERAGISPGTLTKFIKDPEGITAPRDTTLNTIARAHGIPPFSGEEAPLIAHSGGFDEDGAAQLTPKDLGGHEEFTKFKNIYNDVDENKFWVMHGDALENIGIYNGTILVVDYARTPKEGDIVCLSLRDEQHKTAKTIFRKYIASAPVGVCAVATNNENIRPLIHFIDGINVKIYGVVSMSLRKH